MFPWKHSAFGTTSCRLFFTLLLLSVLRCNVGTYPELDEALSVNGHCYFYSRDQSICSVRGCWGSLCQLQGFLLWCTFITGLLNKYCNFEAVDKWKILLNVKTKKFMESSLNVKTKKIKKYGKFFKCRDKNFKNHGKFYKHQD